MTPIFRRRYIVTSSLIGWAHTQIDPLKFYVPWEPLFAISECMHIVQNYHNCGESGIWGFSSVPDHVGSGAVPTEH